MILIGEKNTSLIQETKWNLIFSNMGQKVYLNHGISKHCIVIGKKMKGYNKFDPKENEGQLQSSLEEFFQSQKDQGI